MMKSEGKVQPLQRHTRKLVETVPSFVYQELIIRVCGWIMTYLHKQVR